MPNRSLTNVLMPTEKVTCPSCGCEEDQKAFVFYEPPGRDRDFYCLKCRKKFQEEERISLKQEKQMRDLAAEIGRQGNKDTPNLSTISDLWAEMVDQFGGADQIAAFWKQQLMVAASSERGAGSTRVLTACATLARLCAMSSQYQVATTPVGRMTDEEITQELITVLRQLPSSERRRILELTEATDVKYSIAAG